MLSNMPLQISERVRLLAEQAEAALSEQFSRIDSIAEYNTHRVLAAFRNHRVAESYFAGTTGYGYDDLGRDQLDLIYADLFGTEDALVVTGLNDLLGAAEGTEPEDLVEGRNAGDRLVPASLYEDQLARRLQR